MLTHPTYDRLLALGLTGIASALEEQRRSTAFDALSFEERLGLLVDCALGHKACRDGRPVLYQRATRMFEALTLARGDGRQERILKTIARMEVLIIDDWGLAVLTAPERRDLLEVLEDHHGRASTIVTSQLPVEHWHEAIGDPTFADAILDRLVHNAHP